MPLTMTRQTPVPENPDWKTRYGRSFLNIIPQVLGGGINTALQSAIQGAMKEKFAAEREARQGEALGVQTEQNQAFKDDYLRRQQQHQKEMMLRNQMASKEASAQKQQQDLLSSLAKPFESAGAPELGAQVRAQGTQFRSPQSRHEELKLPMGAPAPAGLPGTGKELTMPELGAEVGRAWETIPAEQKMRQQTPYGSDYLTQKQEGDRLLEELRQRGRKEVLGQRIEGTTGHIGQRGGISLTRQRRGGQISGAIETMRQKGAKSQTEAKEAGKTLPVKYYGEKAPAIEAAEYEEPEGLTGGRRIPAKRMKSRPVPVKGMAEEMTGFEPLDISVGGEEIPEAPQGIDEAEWSAAIQKGKDKGYTIDQTVEKVLGFLASEAAKRKQ